MTNFWVGKKSKSVKMNRPFKKAVQPIVPAQTKYSSMHRSCDKLPVNSDGSSQWDITLGDYTVCNVKVYSMENKMVFKIVVPPVDYSNSDPSVWSLCDMKTIPCGLLWFHHKDENGKFCSALIPRILKDMKLEQAMVSDFYDEQTLELTYSFKDK